jgi:hypothetical protein
MALATSDARSSRELRSEPPTRLCHTRLICPLLISAVVCAILIAELLEFEPWLQAKHVYCEQARLPLAGLERTPARMNCSEQCAIATAAPSKSSDGDTASCGNVSSALTAPAECKPCNASRETAEARQAPPGFPLFGDANHSSRPFAGFLLYNNEYGNTNNHLRSLIDAAAFAVVLRRRLVLEQDSRLDGSNFTALLEAVDGVDAATFVRLARAEGGGRLEVHTSCAMDGSGPCATTRSLGVPLTSVVPPTPRERDPRGEAVLRFWGSLPLSSPLDLCVVYRQYPFAKLRRIAAQPSAVVCDALGEQCPPTLLPAALALPVEDALLEAIAARIAYRSDVLASAGSFRDRAFGREPFLAVHWRRGDFAGWCQGKPSCFTTPGALAKQVVSVLRHHGMANVFVASNGHQGELEDLRRSVTQELSEARVVFCGEGSFCSSDFRMEGPVPVVSQALYVLADVALLNQFSTYSQTVELLRHAARRRPPWYQHFA